MGAGRMQGVDSITLFNRMDWGGATLENGWGIPVPKCNWQLLGCLTISQLLTIFGIVFLYTRC